MAFLKYKLGDTVIIKEDLITGDAYEQYIFTSSMAAFKGKALTITSVRNNCYTFAESHCFWTESMFKEGFLDSTFFPGDKVRVRSDLTKNVSYGPRFAAEGMEQFRGQIVTIFSIYEGAYLIKESMRAYMWTEEMFEKLEEK